jgi:hypothetical protein
MEEYKIAELMIEHYQKTYETTFELWSQRNRIFLALLGIITIATVLAFRTTETTPVFIYLIAKTLGVGESAKIDELRNSFPFSLLQSILLIVVFYLMVNLYHRSLSVLRYYSYLAALEKEIRQNLNLPDGTIAFTREGEFYWERRRFLQGTVKWMYTGLLGGLLLAFLVSKVWDEFQIGSKVFGVIESLIALCTLTYYGAYVSASKTLDKSKAMFRKEL